MSWTLFKDLPGLAHTILMVVALHEFKKLQDSQGPVETMLTRDFLLTGTETNTP